MASSSSTRSSDHVDGDARTSTTAASAVAAPAARPDASSVLDTATTSGLPHQRKEEVDFEFGSPSGAQTSPLDALKNQLGKHWNSFFPELDRSQDFSAAEFEKAARLLEPLDRKELERILRQRDVEEMDCRRLADALVGHFEAPFKVALQCNLRAVGHTLTRALLGYRGKSVEKVFAAFEALWKARGEIATNKEDVKVPATFGPAGQGKTQLCREVVDQLPSRWQKRDWKVVCLHISCNQWTPWITTETPAAGIFLRCLKLLAPGVRWTFSAPPSVAGVVDKLRQWAAEASGVSKEKVAICLLVDEVMKVPEDIRRGLLDELAGKMQHDLIDEIPTFVLLTSLKTQPVSDVLQTESKRPLEPVPLHCVIESDFEKIIDEVHDLLFELLHAAARERREAIVEGETKAIQGMAIVRQWLEFHIFQAGSHFRSIEATIMHAIGFFVPRFDVLNNTFSERFARLKCPQLANRVEAQEGNFNQVKARWLSNDSFQLRVTFPACPQMPDELQWKLIEIFGDLLLLNRQLWVFEKSEVSQLLNNGALFIRERDEREIWKVRPFVSLPALQSLARNVEAATPLRKFTSELLEGVYNDLQLVHDGDEGKRVKKADRAIERGVPLVMLFRALAAAKVFKPGSHATPAAIPFSQLLPEAKINVGEGRELVFPLPDGATRELVWTDTRTYSTANEATDELLKTVLNEPTAAVFFMQGNTNTENIEGACRAQIRSTSNKGDVEDRIVVFSMKLRNASQIDSLSVAKGITNHFASDSKLRLHSIVACAVTCCSTRDLDAEEGTILVGCEALSSLLSPFGASFLLSRIEHKAKR